MCPAPQSASRRRAVRICIPFHGEESRARVVRVRHTPPPPPPPNPHLGSTLVPSGPRISCVPSVPVAPGDPRIPSTPSAYDKEPSLTGTGVGGRPPEPTGGWGTGPAHSPHQRGPGPVQKNPSPHYATTAIHCRAHITRTSRTTLPDCNSASPSYRLQPSYRQPVLPPTVPNRPTANRPQPSYPRRSSQYQPAVPAAVCCQVVPKLSHGAE